MVKKKKEPFVKLDRRLLESRPYRLAGPLARDLYTSMMNSLFNGNNGVVNRTARHVSFGPSDSILFGTPKSTHYKYVDVLIHYGIIEELESGGHGKKAVYNLEAWKYNLD